MRVFTVPYENIGNLAPREAVTFDRSTWNFIKINNPAENVSCEKLNMHRLSGISLDSAGRWNTTTLLWFFLFLALVAWDSDQLKTAEQNTAIYASNYGICDHGGKLFRHPYFIRSVYKCQNSSKIPFTQHLQPKLKFWAVNINRMCRRRLQNWGSKKLHHYHSIALLIHLESISGTID